MYRSGSLHADHAFFGCPSSQTVAMTAFFRRRAGVNKLLIDWLAAADLDALLQERIARLLQVHFCSETSAVASHYPVPLEVVMLTGCKSTATSCQLKAFRLLQAGSWHGTLPRKRRNPDSDTNPDPVLTQN